MNLNKGCIEISKDHQLHRRVLQMNLNKGCIEIRLWQTAKEFQTG